MPVIGKKKYNDAIWAVAEGLFGRIYKGWYIPKDSQQRDIKRLYGILEKNLREQGFDPNRIVLSTEHAKPTYILLQFSFVGEGDATRVVLRQTQ